MKQRSVFLRTQSVAVALRAARRAHFEHVSSTRRTGKQLQRMRRASFRRASVRIHLFAAVFTACFASPADAIPLENVLQTTLERNPDLQAAKSGLEQAAGKRLVFRSVALPDAELGVPAGVQAGHRAGESGVKGFAVGRGVLTQTLFNAGLPASLRRGDVEVLIAQQQLNVAVVDQLHAARLAFYCALYNQSLESIRREQQRGLRENAATQRTRFEAGLADKSALTSATVQASELQTHSEVGSANYLIT